MKKLLSMLLVAVMLLSVFSFAAAADGDLSEPGVLPIWTGDEPYVIHVLLGENPKVSDFDDNAYTHWIEEGCNVDLQFSYLPATDTKEKLTAMIAAKYPETVHVDNETVLRIFSRTKAVEEYALGGAGEGWSQRVMDAMETFQSHA